MKKLGKKEKARETIEAYGPPLHPCFCWCSTISVFDDGDFVLVDINS